MIPVAGELGATAAQVAIRGLEIELTPDPFGRLAGVGDFRAGFPRNLESEDVRGFIFGDTFELIDDPRAPSRSPVATTA